MCRKRWKKGWKCPQTGLRHEKAKRVHVRQGRFMKDMFIAEKYTILPRIKASKLKTSSRHVFKRTCIRFHVWNSHPMSKHRKYVRAWLFYKKHLTKRIWHVFLVRFQTSKLSTCVIPRSIFPIISSRERRRRKMLSWRDSALYIVNNFCY